jgi:hypothetical protein
MLDPQPAFGRLTAPPCDSHPRDAYEWLCEAENILESARRNTLPLSRKLALLQRVASLYREQPTSQAQTQAENT